MNYMREALRALALAKSAHEKSKSLYKKHLKDEAKKAKKVA